MPSAFTASLIRFRPQQQRCANRSYQHLAAAHLSATEKRPQATGLYSKEIKIMNFFLRKNDQQICLKSLYHEIAWECVACYYSVTHNDFKYESVLFSASSWKIKSTQALVLYLYFGFPLFLCMTFWKDSFHNDICSMLILANEMQTGFMSCLPLNLNSATPHRKIFLIFFFDLRGCPLASGILRLLQNLYGLCKERVGSPGAHISKSLLPVIPSSLSFLSSWFSLGPKNPP